MGRTFGYMNPSLYYDKHEEGKLVSLEEINKTVEEFCYTLLTKVHYKSYIVTNDGLITNTDAPVFNFIIKCE